jgi:hypothetical protein
LTRSVFRKYCHLKSDKAFHRVDQIERQYARNLPLSKEMAINLQSFGGANQ